MTTFASLMEEIELDITAGYQIGPDETLPILGWNRDDVREFRTIWAVLVSQSADGKKGLGATIVIWMIENIPNVKKYFHFYDATGKKLASGNDVKFLRHSLKIVEELDYLIKNIGAPDCIDSIRILTRWHMHKNIKSDLFAQFRDRFHLLIFDLTRTGRKGRPATMWYEFINLIYTIYKQEEDAERKRTRARSFKNMLCCCCCCCKSEHD